MTSRSDNSGQSDLARYERGMAAYRQGRNEEAIAMLEGVDGGVDLKSRVARYYEALAHRQLGIDALRLEQYDLAQTHLRAAMQTLGTKSDLSRYLAALYAKTSRPESCAAELDKTIASQGSDAALCRRLALAQWQAGRRAEAYMTLTAGLRKLPAEGKLHLQLGLFYAAEEDYSQARASIEKAALLDCCDGEARYWLGLVDVARGDLPSAIASLQRALELGPLDVMAAYQLSLAGKAARQMGMQVVLRLPEGQPSIAGESSNSQLADFIAAEPGFIEAFLDLPQTPADDDLFELLCGAVTMALARHPRYADLHCYAGRILYRLGRADEAIEHLQQAIEINGAYVKCRIELARQLVQAGRADEALAHLLAAIKSGADWPDVHCLAGEILCRRGQTSQGRGHLERALQLNGKYTPAADAMKLLAA